VKAGDRVKTDQRDAVKLARSYRAGDLTPVWMPDAAHEALRDLVRARWAAKRAAKRDQLRARHRLSKFLLRQERRAPEGTNAWTDKHLQWIRSQVHFAHRPQQVTLEDYLHEVDYVAAHRAARALDRCRDRDITAEDARGDRGAPEPARRCPDQRITTMMASVRTRSTNIRVINRRTSLPLPACA